MKNNILFIPVIIFTFVGCSSVESNNLIEDKTQIQMSRPKGVLPSGHKVNELTLLKGKFSWTDLDDYYRNVLPIEKRQDYYKNAKKMLISSMVNTYGLLEKGDDKSIRYYLHELQDLKLMDPSVTLKILIRAKKSMNPNEVKNIAVKIYDFNQKIIADLENPELYLAGSDTRQKWEELRVFAERQN